MTFKHRLKRQPTCPERLVMLNNTRPLRFTAAAGTKLAGASPTSNVIILLVVLSFTTYDRSSLNGHYWIKLSLIVQDSSLLPPGGV